MSKKRLEITDTNGSIVVVAYQYRLTTPNVTFLEELTGWDEEETFVLTTEQKLNGAGTYIISTQIGERKLQITLNMQFATEIGMRNFRDDLIQKMLSTTEIVFNRKWETNGVTRTETVKGYFTSISSWKQTNENVSIRVGVTCPTPTIVTT